jgi:hypothetical protein
VGILLYDLIAWGWIWIIISTSWEHTRRLIHQGGIFCGDIQQLPWPLEFSGKSIRQDYTHFGGCHGHMGFNTQSWSSMTWMGLTPHDFGHLQIFINHILLVISPYYMFIVRSPFSTAKSWKYPPSLGEFSHLVIFAQALYFDASSRSYAYRLWRSGCWPKNGCVGCHGSLQERRKNVWNIQSYPLVN